MAEHHQLKPCDGSCCYGICRVTEKTLEDPKFAELFPLLIKRSNLTYECSKFDFTTRLCTDYENRPQLCREFFCRCETCGEVVCSESIHAPDKGKNE